MKHSTTVVFAGIMGAAAAGEGLPWYSWVGLVVLAAVAGFFVDKAYCHFCTKKDCKDGNCEV